MMVQSRLTVMVPVIVSWAKAPPTLRSWLPVTLPFRSKLTKPTAATGAGPLGKINVPMVVNPKLPAAVALVQAAWRLGITPKIDHIINARIFVLFMVFLLLNANLLFPLLAGSNLQNPHPGRKSADGVMSSMSLGLNPVRLSCFARAGLRITLRSTRLLFWPEKVVLNFHLLRGRRWRSSVRGGASALVSLRWMNTRENCAKKVLRFAYRNNLCKFCKSCSNS